MYKSEYFYLKGEESETFIPKVLSAWRISVDADYEYEREESNGDIYALIRGVTGTGQLYTTAGSILIEENGLIILPLDDIVRYCSASPNWRYNWVNFSAERLSDKFETGKLYTVDKDGVDEGIFNRLLALGVEDDTLAEPVNSLFCSYYYYLYSILVRTMRQPAAEGIMNEIVKYVDMNITDKLLVSGIAERFGLSERRTEQLFSQHTGMSPKKFICAKKADKAADLLIRTTMSIRDIAQTLGYSSSYHFTREFTRLKGKSPTLFRRMGSAPDPLKLSPVV